MALELSNPTQRALDETTIEPNIAVRIDGVDQLFSAVTALEAIFIGDDFLFIGGKSEDKDNFIFKDDWFIGGFCPVMNNKEYIDLNRTTFSIRQQINYDEAEGSSIQTMNIALVDKNQEITELISPGFIVDDILGRKFQVYYGFGTTSFFDDYVLLFRGFCTTIQSLPGVVVFKLNHPDNKKNVQLFKTSSTTADGAINASQTTITADDTSNFFEPSDAVATYIRIDDEIMQYTGISGNDFTGLTRGSLGTTATPHDDGAQISSIISLTGNPFDLALKLMISDGTTDPTYEDIEIKSFVQVGAGNTEIDDAIYFEQINIPQDFGLQIGDTVTVTGAANGANNITDVTVTDIQRFQQGFYIVVDGAGLVVENPSDALLSFKSQYNTLPDGMRMKPDEVDITQHIFLRDFFFSATNFEIFVKEEEIQGKEFLEKQLYQPIACYSLPRKAAASVGYTIGPIPGDNIKTIDDVTSRNPRNVVLERGTNRSFFNEIVYKYDDDPASSDDNFLRGLITISEDSKNRIPGTTKTFVIEAKGVRTADGGENIASQNSQRLIDRYQFGAERVRLELLLRDSVDIEIGDIVTFEGKNLQVSDTTVGTRDFVPRLFEVQTREVNLKNGQVNVILLDTGLGLDTRYGLMSPCSLIGGVVNQSQFTIKPKPLYPSKFGNDEFRKWENVVGVTAPASIRVHNEDYSVDEDLVLTSVDGNLFTLQDPATITLTPELIVEFTGYVDPDTSDKQQLVWAYMTDDANFPDGGNPYTMI